MERTSIVGSLEKKRICSLLLRSTVASVGRSAPSFLLPSLLLIPSPHPPHTYIFPPWTRSYRCTADPLHRRPTLHAHRKLPSGVTSRRLSRPGLESSVEMGGWGGSSVEDRPVAFWEGVAWCTCRMVEEIEGEWRCVALWPRKRQRKGGETKVTAESSSRGRRWRSGVARSFGGEHEGRKRRDTSVQSITIDATWTPLQNRPARSSTFEQNLRRG